MSALTAIAVIITNRANARRRGTLDLILHIESDSDLIAARKTFINVQKADRKSASYAVDALRDSAETLAIKTVLNIHELTAVSIQEGVIDERVFRKWFNRTFISDYESMTGFIEAIREYRKNPAIFMQLERLAKEWKADASFYNDPTFLQRKLKAAARLWRA